VIVSWVTVPAMTEEKFPFVVGTPECIRLSGAGELGPGGAWASPAPMVHQAVSIKHGVVRLHFPDGIVVDTDSRTRGGYGEGSTHAMRRAVNAMGTSFSHRAP